MKSAASCIAMMITWICTIVSDESHSPPDWNWPMFRGNGSSHAIGQELPKSWSNDSLKWKTEIGGIGQSSPVGWKDRLFTTSVKGKSKDILVVSCFQLRDGTELWTYEQDSATRSEVSDYSSWAAPTPVVDGKRVYAFFEDGDLFAITHRGEMVWKKDLRGSIGPFEGNHGLGASPILTRKGLVLSLDHEGQSFLISVDKENGNLQWQTKRQTSSAWASPSLISTNVREIIVISASRTVIAYDASHGEILWEVTGIIGNNVPSVTISGNWMAIGSNPKGHCRVLRLKEGQVEEVWRSKEASSSFGSPLIYKGRVYFVNKTGFLFCHDLKTGVLLYDYRLPSSTWATPLAAGDHAWFFTQSGHTVILKASDELEVASESSIDIETKDRVFGYAIMNGHVVFRTKKQLICVGK